MCSDEVTSTLMRTLAGYLHGNPHASDTCEGALDWWLGRQGGATWQQVQDAFDALVSLGVVERVAAADGKIRYRCASADAATLARLLRETETHHGAYEATAPKHQWSDWYAAYIVARERGGTPDESAKAAALHVERVRRPVEKS